jgi:hypothetical protein
MSDLEGRLRNPHSFDKCFASYEERSALGVEAADRIRELEAEVERLANIERAWSKANLEIVAKCSAVEKENAALRAALNTQTGGGDE